MFHHRPLWNTASCNSSLSLDLTSPSRHCPFLCSPFHLNSLKEFSGLSFHAFSFSLLNTLQRGCQPFMPPKQWTSDLCVPEPVMNPSSSSPSSSQMELTHPLPPLGFRSSWFSSYLTDCSSSIFLLDTDSLDTGLSQGSALEPLSTLVP